MPTPRWVQSMKLARAATAVGHAVGLTRLTRVCTACVSAALREGFARAPRGPLNRWGPHLWPARALRRRLSGRLFRYPRSRPDAAAGGNRCAMTMRAVPEAVKPRARAQVPGLCPA